MAALKEVASSVPQTPQTTALDNANLATLLRKDAVYNAVGLAAFDLYEEVGRVLRLKYL